MGVEYEFVVQRKQSVWWDIANFQVSKCYRLANLAYELGSKTPPDECKYLIEEMDSKCMKFCLILTGPQFLSIAAKDHSEIDLYAWEIRWLNAITNFIRAMSIDVENKFEDIRILMFAD